MRQDAERRAIADDVMERDDQVVPLGIEPDQQRADERPPREVEGTMGLAPHDLRRDALPRGRVLRLQVDRRQGDRRRIGDVLHRPTVLVQERRPQHFVAAHDLGQGARERGHVERARGTAGGRPACSPRCRVRAGRGTRGAAARTTAAGAPRRSAATPAPRPCGQSAPGAAASVQHPLRRAALDLIAVDGDPNAQQAQLRDEFRRGARHECPRRSRSLVPPACRNRGERARPRPRHRRGRPAGPGAGRGCRSRGWAAASPRTTPLARARSTSGPRPATVGSVKRLRIGSSTCRILRTRAITWTARSEWPPRSKKSSWMPTRSTLSTSAMIVASASSVAVRGAT